MSSAKDQYPTDALKQVVASVIRKEYYIHESIHPLGMAAHGCMGCFGRNDIYFCRSEHARSCRSEKSNAEHV